jgi:hypothetical protein
VREGKGYVREGESKGSCERRRGSKELHVREGEGYVRKWRDNVREGGVTYVREGEVM